MKRSVLLVSVILVVLLAGCAGLPGDNGTTADDDRDDSTPEEDAPTTADDAEEDPDSGDTDDPADDEGETPATAEGDLEIHHIDVGQADATLLITPAGETVLIDTGDFRQRGAGVIEYLEDQDIDRIDHLVATHAHADHIGGHDAVIEWAETEGDGIGAAYDSGVPHTTRTYERYLDAIEEYDVDLFTVEEGDELPIDGDLDALVVNPPAGDSGSNLHYNSVSLVFEFGEFTYLTTGDAERDAEERMIDEWAGELDADMYQAGHHGSRTSSTPAFLDVVTPEVVIISSAYESQYGHPHDEVLDAFADRNVETYWTGVHGDVVVTANGTGDIDIATTEAFSTDAADLRAEKPSDDQQSIEQPLIGNAPLGHSPDYTPQQEASIG
ncbi:ComEC/Rec2 family competence protein [Halorubrum vacuolatum]|uniref:Competence protein ComEC n=1 Tax=Halorubrum vacuolatum TaxID=63740 RepID=A0A238YF67_HALVU|nr:MBL fold metallo-hydrolase [Halorubrum vacuolatum]SNR69009.1 competence protein ComEC [Halorubrum vacuolatum]